MVAVVLAVEVAAALVVVAVVVIVAAVVAAAKIAQLFPMKRPCSNGLFSLVSHLKTLYNTFILV